MASIGSLRADLGVNLTALNQGLKRAEKRFRVYTRSAEKFAKVRLGVNIKPLTKSLRTAARAFGWFSKKAITSLALVKKGFLGIRKAAFGMKSLLLATGALFAGRAFLNFGKNFERQLSIVQVVSQATRMEMEGFRKQTQLLGETTEFTATQAAEALRFLSMAGLSVTQAMGALPHTLDLATAGQIDLARAADISTNIMSQMGLQVEELTGVNDALTAVQSTANTNIEEAASAFIYAGAKARSFGTSVIELSGLIGLLANNGIKASQAGTTLRQSMIKLIKPSKEGAEVLARHNIQVLNAAGNTRRYVDVIKDLADANLSALEVTTLFGARAGNIELILSQGSVAIQQYIDKLESMKGVSKSAADVLRKDVQGKLDELKSALQGVLLKAWDKYKDKIKGTMEKATAHVRAFGVVVEEMSDETEDDLKRAGANFGKFSRQVIPGLASISYWITRLSVIGALLWVRSFKVIGVRSKQLLATMQQVYFIIRATGLEVRAWLKDLAAFKTRFELTSKGARERRREGFGVEAEAFRKQAEQFEIKAFKAGGRRRQGTIDRIQVDIDFMEVVEGFDALAESMQGIKEATDKVYDSSEAQTAADHKAAEAERQHLEKWAAIAGVTAPDSLLKIARPEPLPEIKLAESPITPPPAPIMAEIPDLEEISVALDAGSTAANVEAAKLQGEAAQTQIEAANLQAGEVAKAVGTEAAKPTILSPEDAVGPPVSLAALMGRPEEAVGAAQVQAGEVSKAVGTEVAKPTILTPEELATLADKLEEIVPRLSRAERKQAKTRTGQVEQAVGDATKQAALSAKAAEPLQAIVDQANIYVAEVEAALDSLADGIPVAIDEKVTNPFLKALEGLSGDALVQATESALDKATIAAETASMASEDVIDEAKSDASFVEAMQKKQKSIAGRAAPRLRETPIRGEDDRAIMESFRASQMEQRRTKGKEIAERQAAMAERGFGIEAPKLPPATKAAEEATLIATQGIETAKALLEVEQGKLEVVNKALVTDQERLTIQEQIAEKLRQVPVEVAEPRPIPMVQPQLERNLAREDLIVAATEESEAIQESMVAKQEEKKGIEEAIVNAEKQVAIFEAQQIGQQGVLDALNGLAPTMLTTEEIFAKLNSSIEGLMATLNVEQKHIAPDTEELPGFATGGFAKKPMVARLAEREPEYIVPESKVGQFVDSFDSLPDSMDSSVLTTVNSGGISNSSEVTYNQNFQLGDTTPAEDIERKMFDTIRRVERSGLRGR